MKEQKRIKKYETIYIAEDGWEFNYKSECLIYEKYYKKNILDLVKNYIIFDSNAVEKISKNKTPMFCYALVIKKLPTELEQYFRILERYKIIEDSTIPLDNDIQYKTLPRLYYCDYSDAFNGGCGYNGWKD